VPRAAWRWDTLAGRPRRAGGAGLGKGARGASAPLRRDRRPRRAHACPPSPLPGVPTPASRLYRLHDTGLTAPAHQGSRCGERGPGRPPHQAVARCGGAGCGGVLAV